MILEPGNVFVICLIGIVAWLLMREIVTWYFKLNRIVLLTNNRSNELVICENSVHYFPKSKS